MIILLIFAFLAGLITVLSPCILPVLPILLAAGAGSGKYRPLGIIIGIVLSFSFFTLTLSSLVHLTGISPDFLRYAAIFLITFFGLTMIFEPLGKYFENFTSGVARLGNLIQEKSTGSGSGFFGGFILGVAIGLIWTPCAGPILATIVIVVATSSITIQTVLLTLAYSLGTAIPMFLIAYGGNKIINSTQALSGYTEIIRKLFGVLMIFSALAVAFHFEVVLQQFTVKYFPIINIENTEMLRKELEKLKPIFNLPISVGDAAPDFVGITEWINSPSLTLSDLKGKVVLIDFWTYSCINCVRTFGYLKNWYEKYKDNNFVIVGVHAPEFEFEKNIDNVKDAVKRFEIKYPVALDNHFQTWQAYNNRYWPAHYLIDQNGIIRKIHFGEGEYIETENAIRALLGLPAISEESKKQAFKPVTPEIYLGYDRASAYTNEISIKNNQPATYDYKYSLATDSIGLKGEWLIGPQSIQSKKDGNILDLNFLANRVYLVMQSATPALINILLDDKPIATKYHTIDMNDKGQLKVNEARMYDILDLKGDNGRHKLTLIFPKDVTAYAFTFGQSEK